MHTESLHRSHVLEAQAAAQELNARAEQDRLEVLAEIAKANNEAMRETQNETALKGQWED